MQRQVIFGLGANLEPRGRFLESAIVELERSDALKLESLLMSQVYETPAMLPKDAPADWDRPFLNMVVAAYSAAQPLDILREVKAIEKKLGRQPRGVWGPREIDIDILAVGNEVLDEQELTLPHAHMLTRDFVMVPLADVLPRWRHPLDGSGKDASDYAASLSAGKRLVHFADLMAA